MIWDTTYDVRFKNLSPILCERILKHGEMVWEDTKIGLRLSKPTLAEELAACGEMSAFSDNNLQLASTSRLTPATRTELGIMHKTEFRRKAPLKSRKFLDKKPSLQLVGKAN
jgi:hypothetical protein